MSQWVHYCIQLMHDNLKKVSRETRCQKITFILCFTRKSKEKRRASFQVLLWRDVELRWHCFSFTVFYDRKYTISWEGQDITFDSKKETLAQKSLGDLDYCLWKKMGLADCVKNRWSSDRTRYLTSLPSALQTPYALTCALLSAKFRGWGTYVSSRALA